MFKNLIASLVMSFMLLSTSTLADTSPPLQEISQESLENAITAIAERNDLDEVQKNNALKLYRAAKENLRSDQWYQFLTKTYQEAVETNPEKIKALQKEIEELQAEKDKKEAEEFGELSIEEMEQRQAIGKTKLNSLESQIDKSNQELSVQELRLNEIKAQAELAKQKLDEAKGTFAQLSNIKESELEHQGRNLQLKTLIEQLMTEIKMLEIEAISHPSRLQLIKTQLQHLELQRQILLPRLIKLEKALAANRQHEAESLQKQLAQTEKDSADKHLAIQLLSRDNSTYNRNLQTLGAKIEHGNLQIANLKNKSAEITNDFKSVEKKISLAGLSPTLGKILRKQRMELERLIEQAAQHKTIQTETALASLEQFKAETRLKEQEDLPKAIEILLASDVTKLNETQKEAAKRDLEKLLRTNNGLLKKLAENYSLYLRTLADYDFEKQQLLKQAKEYARYLDKRLLWVPSSKSIDARYFVELGKAMFWLFSPASWQLALQDFARILGKQVLLTALMLSLLVTLLLLMPKIERRVCELKEQVRGIYSDQFHYTLRALLYTLTYILPAPLMLFFSGWLLASDAYSTEFSFAVGKGLQDSAVPLLFIAFFHRLFSACGIVKEHFNWSEDEVNVINSQTVWMRFAAPSVIFILTASSYSQISQYADSIGRFAVIAAMVLMSIVLTNILNPKKALMGGVIERSPEGWVARFRYLWYPAAILMPLVVIGFAVAGYYLSALELQQKLITSLRTIFVFIIIHQIILRWLNLAERQLALQNARQRREQTRQNSSEPISLNPEELLIDIPKVSEQSCKVLNIAIGLGLAVSLWMVWRNIFPAFSFLDNVVLWQHMETVDGGETLQATTLTDMLLAFLYLFVMISAVINFPGVMEVLVFSRWAIEHGSRYAANQLIRYLLVAIGIICIANQLGGNWAQVQWLIAALSVGLGFGLQEIFANLVSGIILLSERPIRIGDTVTVGDVTGKVSRIQMRATHIMDWDKKELVVPNKMFITDQLINWTLSEPVTRIVIPLGIAYGSDVELAHKVITETVVTTECVLEDPEPSVLFLGFGDSSLDFSIRVYVAELGDRLPVTHDLHMRLNKALAEHGIEIPFPQRDIHIRSGLEASTKTA